MLGNIECPGVPGTLAAENISNLNSEADVPERVPEKVPEPVPELLYSISGPL